MQTQQLFKTQIENPTVAQGRSADQTAHLNRIRFKALLCRSSARLNVVEACKLLNINDNTATEQYEELLLKTLHQGLNRKPRFHPIGATEETFDEKWLMQAMDCASTDDITSLNFLIKSRINGDLVRSLRFLVQGAAGKFSLI